MSGDPRPLIVHVIHHLVIGGMENGVVNLINHLPEASFRHAVVCIEDFSDFRSRIRRPDVEVVALHRSRIGAMRLRAALYALCRRWRPSIVHTRNQSGLDALLPAALAGVPVRVHGEHGWDIDNLRGEHWKPALLRRLHAPLVTHYVTVSRDLARFLVERIGVRAERITTICNGVDVARFAPGCGEAAAGLPPALARAPQRCLIGTVGRLRPVKDQATLVAAFARVIEQRPALRESIGLLIVGDGPSRPDLQARAQALGVADRVHFAGASADVAEWLRAMDVFVLPSLNEGISNTLLEAMASALPTLATAVGGNPELVREGEGGGLFAPGDIEALAGRLAAYATQPDLRARDGAAARLRAEREFSLERMVQAYAGLYGGLLGRHPSTQSTWQKSC